jgi:hypothetical protein
MDKPNYTTEFTLQRPAAILLECKGERLEGLLLAVGADHIRVALPNRSDLLELYPAGGQWISEDSHIFAIEAFLPFQDVRTRHRASQRVIPIEMISYACPEHAV